MRISKYVRELYNHILKTLAIWMFVVGIICLSLAYSEVFGESKQINGFLASIGNAILSGGVFAVLLKSIQFLGIFREELTTIIYHADYLKGRKDTEDIWRRVCNVITEGRFPDINEQVQDTILKTYLPHVYSYYYDHLFYGIDIKFQDENKTLLVVKETLDFTLKPADRSKDYLWTYESTIELNAGGEGNMDLVNIEVDGVDQKESDKFSREETRVGDQIKVKLSLKLRGRSEYRITVRENKHYPLDPYNNKVFSAGRFINNAEVQVTYPPELRVVFHHMGTPKEFEDRPKAGAHLISKEYKGLIFPHQGFRIVFQKS